MRKRAGGRDRDGKPKPSAELPIPGTVVIPRRSGEGEEGTIVLDGWKLVCPKGTELIPSDQIIVRGKPYSILGNVGDYGKKVIVTVESTGATAVSSGA